MTRELPVWPKLPTKRELLDRIDEFLRTFAAGEIEAAFALCPPEVWVQGQGMKLLTDLDAAALGAHLEHAMFGFLVNQSALEDRLADAVPSDPRTWCAVITPPGDVAFEDISLEFPSDLDGDAIYEAADDTVATEEGEVLANVHVLGEACDITGRYSLRAEAGGWLLAFSNFDVM